MIGEGYEARGGLRVYGTLTFYGVGLLGGWRDAHFPSFFIQFHLKEKV